MLSALVPALLLAQPAAAATADEGQPLPAVVVSAGNVAQQREWLPATTAIVPVDVTALPGAGLSEILAGSAGLMIRNRQNHAQDEQLSVRGFGARSTFGVRGVRLYVDGIPASMPDGQGQLSHFNLDTAQRVEIIRGPFAALHGNSAAGVVRIVTADGRDGEHRHATLVGASHGFWRGSVNARGAGDALDYNVGLTHLRSSGYREHSRARKTLGNAKIGWQLAERQRLTLLANTFDMPEAQDPLGLTRAQYEDDPRQATAVAGIWNTRKSVGQQQLGLDYVFDIDASWQWQMQAYGGQRSVVQYLAIPKAPQQSPLQAGGVIDLDGHYDGLQTHLRSQGAMLDWSLGMSVNRQHQQRRGYENYVGDVLGVRGRLRRDEDNNVTEVDPWTQLRWRIGQHWALAGGLRYSSVRFDVRDHYITADNPDDSGQRRYHALLPVVGLTWQPRAHTQLYASWGHGLETPTFGELGYRSDGGSGLNLALDAARSRSSELGVRLELGEGVSLDSALFHAVTHDELAVATSSGGRSSYRNIGRSTRRGLESTLVASWDDWQLQGALTWLDARFDTSFLPVGGQVPIAAGTRIPGVARVHGALTLDWQPPLGWRGGLRVDHVGAVPVNDMGSESAPGHALLGGYIGYRTAQLRRPLQLFLRMDNVLDRRHVGSVIVNDGNRRYYEPGAGRTITLGLTLGN